MRIRPRLTWHARRAGGIAVGLSLHFPVSVCSDIQELEGHEEEHWKCVTFGIGLIVLSIYFDFEYGRYRRATWLDYEKRS